MKGEAPSQAVISLEKFRGFGRDSDDSRSTVGQSLKGATSRNKGPGLGSKEKDVMPASASIETNLDRAKAAAPDSQEPNTNTADNAQAKFVSLARFRQWSVSSSGDCEVKRGQFPSDKSEESALEEGHQPDVLTVESADVIRDFLVKLIRIATWEAYEAQRRISSLKDFQKLLQDQLAHIEEVVEEHNAHVRDGPKFGSK